MTTSSFSRPTSNVSGLVYANYIPTITTTSAFASNNVGYVNVSSEEEDFTKENFTDEEWEQFKKDVNLEDY